MKRYLCALTFVTLAAGTVGRTEAGPSTSAFVLFSSSPDYRTPETISQAPANFGAFAGDYFIPDINRNALGGHIWAVPNAGGPPTSFAVNNDYISLGGLFLPATGWGANSGRYLTSGAAQVGNGFSGTLYTYDATGARSTFAIVPNGDFSQPRIAPAGFGAYAGQLIVPNISTNQVLAFNPAGTASTVASLSVSPFGLAFAPSNFGRLGGDLFVSSTRGGNTIDAITPDGTVTTFATIPLKPGQTGLRQLEFSPDANFLPGQGELLFVSVSGSDQGGGTLGDVYALDADGDIVASLRADLGLTKFDPRGLLFISDDQLLISDSSDPIYLAQATAFRAVPEPTGLVLAGVCVAGVVGRALQRRRSVA
jgi:hypothetical protein